MKVLFSVYTVEFNNITTKVLEENPLYTADGVICGEKEDKYKDLPLME